MIENEASYLGLYINLDRSATRRQAMEEQLARLGLEQRYARFKAVDGGAINVPGSTLRPGQTGVFLSHARALESARPSGKPVHILEDDALLSENVAPVIEDAISANLFERIDVLFTDMMVHCNVAFMKSLKAEFDQVQKSPGRPFRLRQLRLIEFSDVFHGAFESYVVGAKSIDRVLALYTEEIAKGIKTPVDIFIQKQILAGKLRAGCIFPFITSFRLDERITSTISDQSERAREPAILVLGVLRYLFFLGCDLSYAKQVLDAATAELRNDADPRLSLLAQVTEYVLSGHFRSG